MRGAGDDRRFAVADGDGTDIGKTPAIDVGTQHDVLAIAEIVDAIAGDMVTRLAEQIGPGTGTIILKPDGSPFGQAFEASLKSWGYAVVTDQKTEGQTPIPLAYVIDSHEGQVLARLSTNSVELGRAYRVTAAGAAPASPLSIMRRN